MENIYKEKYVFWKGIDKKIRCIGKKNMGLGEKVNEIKKSSSF